MKAFRRSFSEYFANKRIQQTPYYLISLLTFNMIVIVTFTIILLYTLGFNRQKDRLQELVETQALMIHIVAEQEFMYHKPVTPEKRKLLSEDIIGKISNAHYQYVGFGKTGEFTLGKREGDQIEFLIKQRHFKMDNPKPIPWNSSLGEPMRRALKGEKGVDILYDYRGAVVLAAYQPIKDLGWGLVAKIDLSEIRDPYLEAAKYAIGLTLLLAFAGSLVFWYFLHPLVQDIEDSRHFNRMLINSSSAGLALCTLEGKIIDANKSFLRIIASCTKCIRNISYFDLIAHDVVESEKQRFHALKLNGRIDPYESVYIDSDKKRVPVKISGKLISIKGSPFVWLSVDNITLQKAYEQRLLTDSLHDVLTELPNRLFFNQILNQTIERHEREHKSFALFFIDLNQFKEINDTYGHECGDILLKTVAQRLKENIRSSDFVARLGGDEFTLIIESITHHEEAISIAKMLISKTRYPIVVENCSIAPSLSIGIAFYPEHGSDPSTLLKSADKAMYFAKHQTSEHCTVYSGG
ncbi:diguanylate cyclase domain-containing protein [Sulfuricurvum sp.]|uniref:diguanylate cyclase domain-containing protein n=1 Tax=Sulfuricurvum sp. TaxID=2025608 RepID=UPI002E344872|nr:diguanylate cyclase [Sulfuricurvum sp.]HEX5329903.1 diguanylate cyclase [Sulfuricurvum sp.]